MTAALDFATFGQRLAGTGDGPPPVTETVAAADGTALAYQVHLPDGPVAGVLVFYHGGGASMRMGYDRLAMDLTRDGGLAVCLTDMRGHGGSGGPRGHSPTPGSVWDDVDQIMDRMAATFPGVPLHLGGHSSGAGMLLNHLTRRDPRRPPRSVVFLAPEFGFRAGVYRGGPGHRHSFGRARLWPFLLNAFSGGRLAGGVPAVTLGYDKKQTGPETGRVATYTVNMALAVTPNDPAGQLARLPVPCWIGIAGDDELLDAAKLDAFIGAHAPGNVRRQVLPNVTHLGVILDGAPFIRAAPGIGRP